MRKTMMALVALAGLSVALTGCGDKGANGGSGTTSTAAPSRSTAAGGAVAECAVGTWKSSNFDAKISQSGATATVTGGEGYTLTVSSDGKVVVDFAGMKPMTFAATVNGSEVKGSFTYGGKVNGAVKMPAASATSGTWEPTGAPDFSALTVSVTLTSPIQAEVAKNLPIAQAAAAASAQTGNAIDQQPVLKKGTYRCEGKTLTLGPPAGAPGGTWTLTKA